MCKQTVKLDICVHLNEINKMLIKFQSISIFLLRFIIRHFDHTSPEVADTMEQTLNLDIRDHFHVHWGPMEKVLYCDLQFQTFLSINIKIEKPN